MFNFRQQITLKTKPICLELFDKIREMKHEDFLQNNYPKLCEKLDNELKFGLDSGIFMAIEKFNNIDDDNY